MNIVNGIDLDGISVHQILPNVYRITDADDWRFYACAEDLQNPSRWMPGYTTITDIVVPKFLKNYFIRTDPEKQAQRKRETADMGNLLHDLIEKDLTTGLADLDIPDEAKPALESWGKLKADFGITAQRTELAVWSDRWGYAGTLDIVGSFDGSPAIMDIKTGRYSRTAGWQMAAYKHAYEEQTGERGLKLVGLSIPRDGKPAKPFVYEHEDWCWDCFCGAYMAWKGMYYGKLESMEWHWLHIHPPSDATKKRVVERLMDELPRLLENNTPDAAAIEGTVIAIQQIIEAM